MAKDKGKDKDRISRRDFLRNLGAGVAGAAILGSSAAGALASAGKPTRLAQAKGAKAAAGKGGKTRVAVVRNNKMLEADGATPNPAAVMAALDAGMLFTFGVKDVHQAWEHVAGPNDTVCIKASCISALIYSNPEVANAIAQRLTEVGVKPENIIIYERTTGELARDRFKINRDGKGVRCYGTDGAYADWIKHMNVRTRITKILSDMSTVLIDMPVLKHHGGAGVTVSMKNHYGTICNPGDMHANWCNPACAQVSNIPTILDKTRLIVCDASRANFNKGPGGTPDTLWPAKTLMVSTNMVAMDTIGLEMIDAERAKHGLGSVAKEAGYIATAASYGMGPNDRAKMDVLETEV